MTEQNQTRNIMGSSNVKILTLDQVVLSEAQIEEEKRKFEEQEKAEEARKKKEKVKEQQQALILTLKYPDFQIFGNGGYNETMLGITANKLLRATTGQTLALVNEALKNPDQEKFKILLDKFKNNHLWTSTENLWGREDVIVYDNIDGNMPQDRKSLIKRMQDGDKAVRVVPYGFKTGEQSIRKFIKNPYVIAQIGDLPLDIVADIAEEVSENQPVANILNPHNKNIILYSAVDADTMVGKLELFGGCDGYNINGYALGIKQGEKSSPS